MNRSKKIGVIVSADSGEKYCLNNRIEVLWIDKTFGLAKVFFIEERIIGFKLATDKSYEQNTLNLNVLIRG